MKVKQRLGKIKFYLLTPFNYALGRLYYGRGQYELAAVFYAKTLRNGKSPNSELYYRYANALRKVKEHKLKSKGSDVTLSKTTVISEHLEKIITRHGHNNPKYYTEYAALMEGFKEYQAAEDALLQALSLKPDDTKIMTSLARLYITRKKWWQAKDIVTRIHELSTETRQTLVLLAKASFEMKEYNLAANSYEKAANKATSRSERAEALYLCGLSLDHIGLKERAQQFYINASALDDKHEVSRLGAGAYYQHHKFWDMARDAYQEKLKDKTMNDVDRAEVSFRLGQVLSLIYETDSAIAHMVDAVLLDNRWPKRYFALGKLCASVDDYDRAVEYLQQAKDREIKCNPVYFYELGKALSSSGRHKEAASLFEELILLKTPYEKKRKNVQKSEMKRKHVAEVYLNYTRSVPVDENIILYETFHASKITCNPYAIFMQTASSKRFKDHKHVWAINDLTQVPAHMLRMQNVYFVPRQSIAYQTYLARAKWLINNVTFPDHFIRRDEQKYLNTWHGTPWKTLGKAMANWVVGMANSQRNFLQATHMISSNKFTSNVLIDGYDIKGMYQGSLAELGYPRIDMTINMKNKEKEVIKKRLDITGKKKVLLYAPTWRSKSGSPVKEVKHTERTVQLMMKQGYQVLFRGHQLAAGSEGSTLLSKISVPEDITTNELLAVADLLVTDYSSIYIDFMATDRPILFYLYDRNDYENERGLYYGVEELPGDVATNEEELARELKKLTGTVETHPNYLVTKQKYLPHEDGKAVDRTISYFFDDDQTFVDGEVNSIPPEKQQVLIQGGKFLSNGITTTLISLIKKLDKNKIQPIVTIDSKTLEDSEQGMELLSKIVDEVQVISRCGNLSATSYDLKAVRSYHRQRKFLNDEHKSRYASVYQREYRRIFGEFKFDHIIDFVGFSIVWTPVLAFSDLKDNSKGTKSIYLHNNIQGEIDRRFPNQECMVRLYNEFDNIVSVSEATMNVNTEGLAERYSIPKKKFVFVDNIQNPEDVLERASELIEDKGNSDIFSTNKKSFITIGRLSIEKDHRKLIAAYKKVHDTFPDTQLIIVGDGPLKLQIESVIQKLKLQNNVHLLGHVPNPFPLLKQSDCFVLSSLHEGQPTVLFEALILERPIIATNIPANKGVLKGGYGLLVPGDGPEGLTGGMIECLEGRVPVKKLDIEAYQEKALSMFMKKILKSNP